MGYAGKVVERERARALRAEAWTLAAIAAELGVAKSTVSLWVRDVPFTPSPRQANGGAGAHPLALARRADEEAARVEAVRLLGATHERDRLIGGLALYAGEGFKTRMVGMANTDERIMRFFCGWLREFWAIDESRLRARLYLHQGLDEERAVSHWAAITGIGPDRFGAPYRAAADPSRRAAKHEHGCLTVRYCDIALLRRLLAAVDALLS